MPRTSCRRATLTSAKSSWPTPSAWFSPVGVAVECFGTEHQSLDFIEAYVHDSYDLTPQGIIKRLGLLDVDYNKVSAYGHFGKAGLPWED